MNAQESNFEAIALFSEPAPRSPAPYYGESPLETAVRVTCDQAKQDRPDDLILPALCQIATALALNISKGNTKGRAIANEAMQLTSVLEQIRGEQVEESESTLPQEARDLIDALRSVPRPSGSPVRDPAES